MEGEARKRFARVAKASGGLEDAQSGGCILKTIHPEWGRQNLQWTGTGVTYPHAQGYLSPRLCQTLGNGPGIALVVRHASNEGLLACKPQGTLTKLPGVQANAMVSEMLAYSKALSRLQTQT